MYQNVYYSPEHFGLQILGEAERSDLCYEFDMFVVWEDAGGNLYWADDSGCSCPAPFEDYRSKDSLSTGTAHECLAGLDEWISRCYGQVEDGSLRATLMEWPNLASV